MKPKSVFAVNSLYSRIVKAKMGLAIMFYFLLSTFSAYAQDSIVVSGQFINNTKYAKVLMKKFEVGNFPVGGAAIKDEKFTLTLPPDIPVGVYRFQYAMAQGEKYIDIIINGKDKEIAFTLQSQDDYAFPKFTKSEENQQWYAYLEKTSKQLERIDLLNQFINIYPNANAKVVKAALQEWEEVKSLYQSNFNAFITKMGGTLACEMVANRPFIFTNPKDDPRLQDFEKRERFWDNFDATNPQLINTPLYTDHILNYLQYWLNPNMDFSAEEKTDGFKRAVDVIISKFSGNEATRDFAYKYLTLGFKELGEEEVLQYLDENYSDLAEQCFDDVEKSEFDKRMEGYAAMKEGNPAPNIVLNVTNGATKAKNLYNIKAEKTLVVFWSSTCPHCLNEMPKLNEWAAGQKEVTVVAVSIDMDADLHQETIAQFPTMIHTCDYLGWETQAAADYYIAATPTFILLDDEKKILGKYASWARVEKAVK